MTALLRRWREIPVRVGDSSADGGEDGDVSEVGGLGDADDGSNDSTADRQAPAGSQAQEQAEVESEGGGAAAAGASGTSDEWWDEHAAPLPRKVVRKIKNHHVFLDGAQEGSLATVVMTMEFADGTDTGRGNYIPSEPYLADEGFRTALRRYIATKQGKRMLKYVPGSVLG